MQLTLLGTLPCRSRQSLRHLRGDVLAKRAAKRPS